jgi:hypothetical protein
VLKKDWVQFLGLPFTSCVTLEKSLNLYENTGPCVKIEHNEAFLLAL